MTDFPNGVTYYKIMQANIAVGFPQGFVKCKYCRFCVKDRNSGMDDRFSCLLTYEYIYNLNCVGEGCPLTEVEE